MKILIVEDEENIAALLKDWLEEEGYEADIASEGGEAARKITESFPDAVILDVCLPDISGLAVLKNIKSAPDTKDIPVIMVSSDDDVRDSVNLGASGVVVKPINFSLLLGIIKKVTLK
jgi:DNA-binding response OmpR family regulator